MKQYFLILSNQLQAPESGNPFVTQIAFVVQKMQINVNFSVKCVSTHNAVSHAKTAQSSVLATLWSTLRNFRLHNFFLFLTPHFHFDSTFWLDSMLKLN